MNYPYKKTKFEKGDERYYFTDFIYTEMKRTTYMCFVLIMAIFLVALLSVSYVFNRSYQYITIENKSMQPTINPNPINVDGKWYQDSVYIKLTQDIDYGDIVIIDRSEEEDEDGYTVIKRVMALEGDQISIAFLPVGENGEYEIRFIRIKAGDDVDQIVYQGQDDEYILYEDYILSYDDWTGCEVRTEVDGTYYDSDFYDKFLSYDNLPTHEIIVNVNGQEQSFDVKFFIVGCDKSEDAPDQVFYLGDNRAGSSDSRGNGTADIDKVVGRVIKIFRNGYSIMTSPWSWAEKIYEFLAIIWEELINYFTI